MEERFIKFINEHYAAFTGASAGAAFAILFGLLFEVNFDFDIIPWSVLIAALVMALFYLFLSPFFLRTLGGVTKHTS